MTITDWIQAIAMVVLVGATIFYAYQAKKSRDNAEASVNEMKEQRLSEARPYLLLRLPERIVQWNNSPDLREHRPLSFQITIHNAGKGPAINLYAALWNRGESRHVHDSKGYLVPNEEWQAEINRSTATTGERNGWLPQLRNITKQNETEIIAVEYEDIHKRTWVSYLYLEKYAQDNAFVIAGEQNTVEIKP